MEIPKIIRDLIDEKLIISDSIGMSDASVYLLDDMVLKIQEQCSESTNEYIMMRWLQNTLPVPKIIEHKLSNKLSYLLMSKCTGEMACSERYMRNPKKQAELLAEALHKIWCVDITTCPSDSSLAQKLQQATYNVSNDLVDIQNCEPETFSLGGFKDPEALLHWLIDNKPSEELCLSHGDFCLPNIFFNDTELVGLIDLGRSGVADKWCDIALCYRSLKDNYCGKYSGSKPQEYKVAYFFDALQIKPEWDKIRYYILLDELF